MILYSWIGADGSDYRMASGVHAQHKMQPGQVWELQTSTDGLHWIALVDWNCGVRGPIGERAK